MFCNAFVSWEIQEKLKLRSIISQTVLNKASDSDEVNELEGSDNATTLPKSFVRLCPFQHPELSNTPSSKDTCELRLVCPLDSGRSGGGSCGRSSDVGNSCLFHTASVAATAKVAEVYNGRGEYACTIRGAPIGTLASTWCRFTYSLPEPCSELRFKFLSLASPGNLKLASISLMLILIDSDNPSALPAVSQPSGSTLHHVGPQNPLATSPQRQNFSGSMASSLTQQQQQQQQQQQLQQQTLATAASRHALNNLRQWLDTRLEGIERRLDERLASIEAQLAKLSPADPPAANQEEAEGGQ